MKDQLLKEFDQLLSTLPSHVGDTPRDVVRAFVERTYDTAYIQAIEDAMNKVNQLTEDAIQVGGKEMSDVYQGYLYCIHDIEKALAEMKNTN